MSPYVALERVNEAARDLKDAREQDGKESAALGYEVRYETVTALKLLEMAVYDARTTLDEEAGGEA